MKERFLRNTSFYESKITSEELERLRNKLNIKLVVNLETPRKLKRKLFPNFTFG